MHGFMAQLNTEVTLLVKTTRMIAKIHASTTSKIKASRLLDNKSQI